MEKWEMDEPAFACPASDAESQDGVSKLEYFAARAPHEVPEWFKPVMPDQAPKQTTIIPRRNNHTPLTPSEMRHLGSWMKDPIFDLEPEYSDFRDEVISFWDATKNWNKEKQVQTVIQWPWAWAKMVLEAKPE